MTHQELRKPRLAAEGCKAAPVGSPGGRVFTCVPLFAQDVCVQGCAKQMKGEEMQCILLNHAMTRHEAMTRSRSRLRQLSKIADVECRQAIMITFQDEGCALRGELRGAPVVGSAHAG